MAPSRSALTRLVSKRSSSGYYTFQKHFGSSATPTSHAPRYCIPLDNHRVWLIFIFTGYPTLPIAAIPATFSSGEHQCKYFRALPNRSRSLIGSLGWFAALRSFNPILHDNTSDTWHVTRAIHEARRSRSSAAHIGRNSDHYGVRACQFTPTT